MHEIFCVSPVEEKVDHMNAMPYGVPSRSKAPSQIVAIVFASIGIICLLGTLIAGYMPVETYETTYSSWGESVDCGSAFDKNEAGLTSFGSYACDQEGLDRNRAIAIGFLVIGVALLAIAVILWLSTLSKRSNSRHVGVASPQANATSPPSWSPDPSGRHQLRWWDGSKWTPQVMNNGIPSEDAPF